MAESLFHPFTTDFSKSGDLEFLSFQPPPDAPHPDLFDSELDCSLAALGEEQLQLFTVDSNDAYTLLRADSRTPICGPPSTITVSSESAYESSTYSNSEYLYGSQYHPTSNYSFGGLDMEFQNISVADQKFSPMHLSQTIATPMDPHSFGILPSPPASPVLPSSFTRKIQGYRSQSEYGPISQRTEDFLVPNGYETPSSSPSPPHGNTARRSQDDAVDSRRKYRCSHCPRGFARAFNLKTHMATHDPNRPKPFVCPHRTCSRSFSRKHDLGRHLVSIHRDSTSSHHSAKSAIGVEKGPRGWCETCGKGWVGRNNDCDCHDAK
ncbi:hypothetical protein BDV98DRAFT_559524 [Pterulicium gracile]|uniref:C2H2-type domain-containing protein n=1 Tax=Pterulicium gracile TaxID=1884261 RepID=A0A5C3QX62_9AGAR|nr:hypothetical protein BDV98DRAFT_559524 [Pterula gracilis]